MLFPYERVLAGPSEATNIHAVSKCSICSYSELPVMLFHTLEVSFSIYIWCIHMCRLKALMLLVTVTPLILDH